MLNGEYQARLKGEGICFQQGNCAECAKVFFWPNGELPNYCMFCGVAFVRMTTVEPDGCAPGYELVAKPIETEDSPDAK